LGYCDRVRLVSWNVANWAGQLPAQLDAVVGRDADVIALQEVSARTYGAWSRLARGRLFGRERGRALSVAVSATALSGANQACADSPQELQSDGSAASDRRAPGLVFDDPEHARLAFPEKFVAAELVVAGRPVELHNAHAPPGSTRYLLKPQGSGRGGQAGG
jgi:hypothetical protein